MAKKWQVLLENKYLIWTDHIIITLTKQQDLVRSINWLYNMDNYVVKYMPFSLMEIMPKDKSRLPVNKVLLQWESVLV